MSTIYVGENYVAVPAQEFDQLRPALSIFYGVDAVGQGDYVYLIPQPKSGVLPERREQVKQLLMRMGYTEKQAEWLAQHNQLQLTVLVAVLGAMAVAMYYYKKQISQFGGQLSGYFWRVLIPLLTFGIGAYVGYKVLERG